MQNRWHVTLLGNWRSEKGLMMRQIVGLTGTVYHVNRKFDQSSSLERLMRL